MAHKKAGGSTVLGRDSQPKYLGVKLFGGQKAQIGSIIVRQRGSKFKAGNNVRLGRDYTIYAVKQGVVQFKTKRTRGFDGNTKKIKMVSIV